MSITLRSSYGASLSDAELLVRIGQAERECLDELHRRYASVLLVTAYRIVNNSKDAEDVLQEVFLQIWEKASVFDLRRGKPLTWAMTLTRNKAIDRLRRMQRRHRLHDDLQQEIGGSEGMSDRDSSEEAASHETQTLVRSAVMQLSEDQRRAIEMAFFAGLTQNEIAQKLHEPLGTVKARIRRGMIKLRGIIESKL